MDKIIEVRGLSKRFGDVQAVKNIDFHVNAGQLFAFLGPNGAGKSTTIDIICTVLQADSGEVRINGYTLGKDDFAIRSDIGVVFQTNLLESITLFWSPWGSKDSGCSKIKIAKVKACCYSTFTLAIYCFMDFATNVKKKRKSAPYC